VNNQDTISNFKHKTYQPLGLHHKNIATMKYNIYGSKNLKYFEDKIIHVGYANKKAIKYLR